ncbi:MAG: NADH-quinone oxidoreductase subunit NuoF [Thermoplasmata archaeon]|nr:MAG: NADH-quinone oxidoreductase subunit NuoF [Thermoplasmata archaeon]
MPPTEPLILICQGTSGLSAGADEVVQVLEQELGKHPDVKYKLKRVGDRGLFKDPLLDIVMPDGSRTTYEKVSPDRIPAIVEQHLIGGNPIEELVASEDYTNFFSGQERIVLKNCGEIDPEDIQDYIHAGGFSALRKALNMSPEQVIDEVKNSGIRGRGGAGFPAGVKWGFAKKAAGDKKYLICNADEGDPGAFMDRSVLEGDPFSVIEGMLIAGYAIGASEGIVYVRAEYPLAITRILKAIEQCKEAGYLGENILDSGFSFDIRIKEGAGAFVCGEETALLASIEGERGMPRPRPPFPANKGLWGCPTIINNVETLANIPHIINNGADWYKAIGTDKSTGTKVFALAGRVKNTGLVEVPMGTTLRDVIFGPGGGMAKKRLSFKAVQIGGPSGGCLPESLLDTSIDYESITETGAIMGSGGLVVMDESSCMVDIARFFLNFTVKESCGKCVPCRAGLKKMLDILERIAQGEGTSGDLEKLQRLSLAIKDTALCGLGNTAPNPILTTLKYFRDEYEAHINEKTCPASVCLDLIKFEVDEETCTMCGKCYKACPSEAVIWEKKQKAKIDLDKCIKCRACIAACDYRAIN